METEASRQSIRDLLANFRPLEWNDKVESTKSFGVNKHLDEELIFCCLNPARTKYAILIDSNGDIVEIEAIYLKRSSL